MKYLYLGFLIYLGTLNQIVNAAQTTEEYDALFDEVNTIIYKEYFSCMKEVEKEVYEKSYRKCEREQTDKELNTSCDNVAKYESQWGIGQLGDFIRCDYLRPGIYEFSEKLDELAKERRIKKYK